MSSYSAIQRVYQEFEKECKQYGITCNPEAHVIVVDNVAHRFKPYTEARKLRIFMKQSISMFKKREAAEQLSKQGTLL